MQHLRKILLIITVSIFGCAVVFGQSNLENRKSKNILKIEGLPYYIHIVAKDETLADIALIYNIPIEVIVSQNSSTVKEITAGLPLVIPFVNVNEEFLTKDKIYRIVKPKETLFSLSREYKVSVDQIKKANNLTENTLSVNQYLVIPILQDKVDEKFIYHTIRPDESLSDLHNKFGIKEREIKKLNKDIIEEQGYRAGVIIKIPLTKYSSNNKSEKDTVRVLPVGKIPTVDIVDQLQAVPDGCLDNKSEANSSLYKVAVFLPLYLDENFPVADTVIGDIANNRIKDNEIYKRSVEFIDFYKGFLIAVNQMKQLGLKVEIKVFDTGVSVEKLKKVVYNYDFSDVSLIIGPVYKDKFKIVSDATQCFNINIISPFFHPEAGLANDNNIIQLKNDDKSTEEAFVNLLTDYMDKDVFVVYDSKKDSTVIKMLKTVIEKQKNNGVKVSDTTLARRCRFVDYSKYQLTSRDTIHPLEAMLVPYKENIVFMPSTEKAFVYEVASKFNSFNAFNHPTSIVGPSTWRNFTSFNFEMLYNLKYRTLTTNYVDYNKYQVKNYVGKYRDFYKQEPTKYSFHGYDVGVYFLNALFNYGKDFKACLPDNNVVLLRQKFKFQKIDGMVGFVNVGLFDLKYNKDYTIDYK